MCGIYSIPTSFNKTAINFLVKAILKTGCYVLKLLLKKILNALQNPVLLGVLVITHNTISTYCEYRVNLPRQKDLCLIK